jgi:hypothetical protein
MHFFQSANSKAHRSAGFEWSVLPSRLSLIISPLGRGFHCVSLEQPSSPTDSWIHKVSRLQVDLYEYQIERKKPSQHALFSSLQASGRSSLQAGAIEFPTNPPALPPSLPGKTTLGLLD